MYRDIYIPASKEQHRYARKNDKVAAKIKERLADSLIQNDLPGLGCCTLAITYVDLSPDLRNAKVYIMPYDKTKSAEIIKTMVSYTYHFKNILAKKIKLQA